MPFRKRVTSNAHAIMRPNPAARMNAGQVKDRQNQKAEYRRPQSRNVTGSPRFARRSAQSHLVNSTTIHFPNYSENTLDLDTVNLQMRPGQGMPACGIEGAEPWMRVSCSGVEVRRIIYFQSQLIA